MEVFAARTVKFINDHNIVWRKVNNIDRKCARTDYQRSAGYIISDGEDEFYWDGKFASLAYAYKHLFQKAA